MSAKAIAIAGQLRPASCRPAASSRSSRSAGADWGPVHQKNGRSRRLGDTVSTRVRATPLNIGEGRPVEKRIMSSSSSRPPGSRPIARSSEKRFLDRRGQRGRGEVGKDAHVNRKLVVFVPREALDRVRSALFEAGAGKREVHPLLLYAAGTGTFLAGEETSPAVGQAGREQRRSWPRPSFRRSSGTR